MNKREKTFFGTLTIEAAAVAKALSNHVWPSSVIIYCHQKVPFPYGRTGFLASDASACCPVNAAVQLWDKAWRKTAAKIFINKSSIK